MIIIIIVPPPLLLQLSMIQQHLLLAAAAVVWVAFWIAMRHFSNRVAVGAFSGFPTIRHDSYTIRPASKWMMKKKVEAAVGEEEVRQ